MRVYGLDLEGEEYVAVTRHQLTAIIADFESFIATGSPTIGTYPAESE